jgi:NAD(P)-dependent dehydrogenase (short-subunit alcohol dehydrogenase family)
VLVAASPSGFALPGLLTVARVEVVDDDTGFGEPIAARLRRLGVDARVVAEVSAEAQGVIFVKGLCDAESAEKAIAVQLDALKAASSLAKRQGERIFVTLQDTGGEFGFSGRAGERAWMGGLPGLAKTAAAEWPDAAVKAIDVARTGGSPDVVADRVVSELVLGGRDVEVALGRSGGRAVVVHRPAVYGAAPEGGRVRSGSVVIVSGGARGVTAAALTSICKYGPRLALLGRTELVEESAETQAATTDADIRRALLARAASGGAPVQPKELARQAKLILDCREIRENVAALQRAGAEVSYHAVDVRSAEAVRLVVDDIRRQSGPIRGIVHGAGVLADGLLSAQTDEQFDRVFGTKVEGLRHLLAATANDPLELLIMFSSVAGRFGNSAQAAYAMANEVLSCVAASERARRGPRSLVRSLAWGPWAGGMVTPGLAKLIEKAGVKLVALDVGAKALAREVESDDDWPQVILMNGEPPATARAMWGGPTVKGDGNPAERFDVLVNADSYPFLQGHCIAGAPVVPAVMVLEWFFRAAAVCCPLLEVASCSGLKVLRGVRVEGFDGPGIRLSVHARRIEQSATRALLELRLLDHEQKPRYVATVEMGGARPPPASVPDAPADGKPWPWSLPQAYSDVLFHRGPFAAIQSLGVVSESGASGQVAGLRVLGWPDGGWSTDAAAMDGGVQLAVLWGAHLLGRPPLPTTMGAFHLYRRGPVEAAVRVVVKGRRVGQYRVLADIAYLTEAGGVLGYMQDLELHVPPSANRQSEPGAA